RGQRESARHPVREAQAVGARGAASGESRGATSHLALSARFRSNQSMVTAAGRTSRAPAARIFRESRGGSLDGNGHDQSRHGRDPRDFRRAEDRKSTRLNSSHVKISYAVFCLKQKTNKQM